MSLGFKPSFFYNVKYYFSLSTYRLKFALCSKVWLKGIFLKDMFEANFSSQKSSDKDRLWWGANNHN